MNVGDLPRKIAKRIAVDDSTGCWLWTAGRAGSGYAYGWWNGGMSYIHRVTYHLLVDRSLVVRGAAKTHCIDHVADRCANKHCVNPAHLELVEWGENLRRFHADNPGHNAKGWITRRLNQQNKAAA